MNIMDTLEHDELEELHQTGSLSSRITKNSSSSINNSINLGRVSPMLRSIVKNDSFLSKKTVLTYKDKKALSQCPSSVISDKANHEELPEIRA